MAKVLLIHAPGLSAEEAVRGDQAAHLSDLIADGSFARLSGPPEPAALAAAVEGGAGELLALPFRDMASFDQALGEARARASTLGAEVAVVSETVFVSQRYFPELRPGRELAPGEVAALLGRILERSS